MTPSRPDPNATSLLTLQGPDALEFAHAQFTSNVSALEPGRCQWSAWLDARGRVQYLFHLARADEHTLLAVLRGGDAADMAERLRRYLFRSRVTLVPHADLAIHGAAPGPAYQYEATAGMHYLGLGDRGLTLQSGAGDGDRGWRLEAIHAGEPWLPDTLLDTFLPPALCLRRLGALSLGKGCYPGQEIAARLHYHGGHKHALAHVRMHAPAEPGADALPGLSGSDAMAVKVLDCVAANGMHDALVVLHESVFARLRHDPGPVDGAPMLVRRFEP